MGEQSPRFWHTAREYATNWAVGGLIIMATGFAPEELMVRLADALRIPQSTLNLWAGIDVRTVIVLFGVAIVVGDLLLRGRSLRAARIAENRGVAVRTAPQAVQTTPGDRLPLPDEPSIAVLPFENMSGEPDQEYFTDGVVEDIITALSRVTWLFVIARNSSFTYKGRAVEIKQIGRELGVRYVLEGSVRRAGGSVRITTQLIDAATGAQIWAERYDRSLDNIFALQDEITLSVVGAIEPSLRQAEIARVKRKRPDSLDAYDVVLRAWPLLYSRMPKDADEAIPLFEKALELDAGYGLAHAGLAWCFHAKFHRGGHREEDDTASVCHAKAAIILGADDATALAIAAFVISVSRNRDNETSIGLFDRALMLSPSCSIALGYGSVSLALLGRIDAANERALKALRQNPFDPFGYAPHSTLAFCNFFTGRFEKAADEARRAIEINPRFSFLYALLAAPLVRLGQIDDAKAAAQKLLAIEPNFTIAAVALLCSAFAPDRLAPFLDALRAARLPE